MITNTATLTVISDDQLWQQSCAGDREAFGKIVERYQSMVCSLAYSACGNLSRSEDLAQETFLAAWQKLGELREPSKLRAWLCGIVRNLAANAVRREIRRGGPAESLDLMAEPATAEGDPAAHAVTHEEETLLWRSLARLPETYREPLVLFYRQEQSVAEVASSLELSEEAVKQRLTRGRTMLREEMAGLVESTLTRTRPTTAFTVGVLVALPMASASAATAVGLTTRAVVSGSASAAGKSIIAKIGLGPFVGPLTGLLSAWLGMKAAASATRSREERDYVLRRARGIVVFCFAMSIGLAAVLTQAGKLYAPSAAWIVSGVMAWTVVLVGAIMLVCHRMDREVKRIRIATNTTDDAHAKRLAAQGKRLGIPKYFESRTRFLGLPLFTMAWGGHGSDRFRRRTVCGWIAIGDTAVSPFLALGGFAIAPIAVGAVSIGVLSLSLFWGVAFGVFALGGLAFGWWALGCAAAGVKCAVGFAAVARDYAVGFVTSATEAGTAVAKNWVKTEWLPDFVAVIARHAHWWILGCIALALVLRVWRDRKVVAEKP